MSNEGSGAIARYFLGAEADQAEGYGTVSSPHAKKQFDEGAKLLEEGQTEEALKVFSSALTSAVSDRDKGQTLYNIAICHLRLGGEDSAIDALQNAVSLQPWLAKEFLADEDFSRLHDSDVATQIRNQERWAGSPDDSAGVREEDLRAFVGDEADHYLERWQPLLDGGGGFVGFNWPAFFFNWFWFLYRKMYWTGVALIALLIVINGFVGGVQFGLSLLFSVLLGLLANQLYYRKAKRVITKVLLDHPAGSDHSTALAAKGGTNGTLIVIILVIQAALVILALVLSGGELP